MKPEEDIKKVERRHAAEVKKMQVSDKPKAPKPTAKGKTAQSEKFIDAAKELGCDENESIFDEIVKNVVKAPSPRKDEGTKPITQLRLCLHYQQ